MERIPRFMGLQDGKLGHSTKLVRFRDEIFSSLAVITLTIFTPPGAKTILLDFETVGADFPPLLCRNILDRLYPAADTVQNRLAHQVHFLSIRRRPNYISKWSVPPVKSESGHGYVQVAKQCDILFSRIQLMRGHGPLFHPSSSKLHSLIAGASLESATPETRLILKDICKRCNPCQRIKLTTIRLRISAKSENVRSKVPPIMGIAYIDSRPLLRIVDEATRFSPS